MSVFSTALLSLSMSADAFAVSLGRGACSKHPRLKEAMRTALVFGGVEACAPVLGWTLGLIASTFIKTIDHWLAFGILGLVGAHMIYESLRKPDECDCKTVEKDSSRMLLLLTAIGTSIDSMAVGVSLAFVDVDILVTALSIGLATFTMSTIGLMAGHKIGSRLGQWAEAAGGLCLIAIGIKTLWMHLTAG